MRITKRILLATSALLTAGVVSSAAFAGEGHAMRGGLLGKGLMKTLKDLDLTPQQKEIVKKNMSALKDARQSQKADNLAALRELEAEVRKPNPDPQKLHALANRRMESMNQQVHARIDGFIELHRSLTPEQREKLGNKLGQLGERLDRPRGR